MSSWRALTRREWWYLLGAAAIIGGGAEWAVRSLLGTTWWSFLAALGAAIIAGAVLGLGVAGHKIGEYYSRHLDDQSHQEGFHE